MIEFFTVDGQRVFLSAGLLGVVASCPPCDACTAGKCDCGHEDYIKKHWYVCTSMSNQAWTVTQEMAMKIIAQRQKLAGEDWDNRQGLEALEE